MSTTILEIIRAVGASQAGQALFGQSLGKGRQNFLCACAIGFIHKISIILGLIL